MKKGIPVVLVSSLLGIGMTFNALAVDYSDPDVVLRIQEALNEEGYDCGTPDGKAGAKTNAAVAQFREEHGLTPEELIDDDLAAALGLSDLIDNQDAASTSTTDKEILFRDIPWYSTKLDTEKALFEAGAKEAGSLGSKDSIYRMSGTNFSSVTIGDDRIDGGGYRGWYSGIDVAGYTPSDTYACYVFPIEKGKVVRSDDDALFYFGWYQFDGDDYQDYQGIYDDFVQKLTSLYGDGITEADKYKDTTTWKDSDGNQIRLLIDDDKSYVCLAYMAAGAEGRLDEIQAALDAEALAAEEAQREENQNNVEGL